MSLLVSVFIIIENFIGMRRILCFGFLDTGSPARPERILVIHPFVALGKLILSFREFIDVFEAEGRAQVYFETTAGSFLRRNDNSAISGPYTIQCRGSSPFENTHGFDIMRIQIAHPIGMVPGTASCSHCIGRIVDGHSVDDE